MPIPGGIDTTLLCHQYRLNASVYCCYAISIEILAVPYRNKCSISIM
jgi:hypothetical protein